MNYVVKRISIFLLLIMGPLLIGYTAIGAYGWDLSVPFYYGMHDDIWQLLLSKGLLDNGWVFHNAYMGAPFESEWYYHAAAQTSAIHSIIMKFIFLFTNDAIEGQQIYYFLNFSLISLTTYYSCRCLNINYKLAILSAFIFSLTTVRFNWIFLAFLGNYFVVPLSILVVVWCVNGALFNSTSNNEEKTRNKFFDLNKKKLAISTVFILLTAISDGYYSFFTLLLLGFSVILISLRETKGIAKKLIPPCYFSILILVTFFILMGPINAYKTSHVEEFYPNGKVDPAYIKSSMEAEVYSSSLKLLLAPITNHRIDSLADIGKKIVNTSDLARKIPTIVPSVSLGTFVSIFFLLSLLLILAGEKRIHKINTSYGFEQDELKQYSYLILFIFLASISGGIGTLIALIFPTIRAYERFPIFLIFFVLLFVGRFFTCVLSNRLKKNHWVNTGLLLVAALVIFDQIPKTAGKSMESPEQVRFIAERAFIADIENNLKEGSMVYQYPFSEYLDNNQYYGHGAFGQMRAYLHSKKLRWSNGASRSSVSYLWHKRVSSLGWNDKIMLLPQFGFKGMLVDLLVLPKDEIESILSFLKQNGIAYKFSNDAKMLYFDFEYPGFYMQPSSTLELNENPIEYLVITDRNAIIKNKIPFYFNEDYFNSLLKNEERESFKIDKNDLSKLINRDAWDATMRAGEKIYQINELNAEIDCPKKYSGGELRLKINNMSEYTYHLNIGPHPIKIGYHIVDDEGKVLLWDNGFRVDKQLVIMPESSETLSLSIEDINIDAYQDSFLVFDLLQEGNAWFNSNINESKCKIKI